MKHWYLHRLQHIIIYFIIIIIYFFYKHLILLLWNLCNISKYAVSVLKFSFLLLFTLGSRYKVSIFIIIKDIMVLVVDYYQVWDSKTSFPIIKGLTRYLVMKILTFLLLLHVTIYLKKLFIFHKIILNWCCLFKMVLIIK